jgi:DNA-binding NarL/FixJ family response regulator
LLIESRAGLKVVGEAGTRCDAVLLTNREKPDVILLDLDTGGGRQALDFMPELLTVSNETRILALTGMRDQEIHQRVVRLGAMGLVLQEKAAEDLLKAIEKVHAGEAWLDRSLTASVISKFSRPGSSSLIGDEEVKIASLSGREREVITLVGEGLKNKQIAERLFISETTVRHHLTSIFSKLDIASRFELIIFVYRHQSMIPSTK